ncbi:Ig-like domain-containing protein [Zooshikella ganghwensis]|uniref:Dystroglycan-type cadherin-like domain-containing protein n=1 Tax=Zooshikella ganghwensis TaxID=202772 RepID=A0A4P9VIG6_9GAMM|nr:cadherin-like domain-containing protein [Zooshikella ganghwensis]RDH42020.1 hypothetical protein B9G39_00385 [Zooshikella ganghwensis]
MSYTYEEALIIFEERNNNVRAGNAKPFSFEEIIEVIKNTSGKVFDNIDKEGKPYLLYSGDMPNKQGAYHVSNALRNRDKVLVISHSHVGRLANQDAVTQAIQYAAKKKLKINPLITDDELKKQPNKLQKYKDLVESYRYGKQYSGGPRNRKNSLFDVASAKFVAAADGNFTLAFPELPKPESVFSVAELPVLLEKGKQSDFKIDGVSIKELIHLADTNGVDAVKRAVTANSIAIYGASGLFTNVEPGRKYGKPKYDQQHIKNWKEITEKINSAESKLIIKNVDGVDIVAPNEKVAIWTDEQLQHYQEFIKNASPEVKDLVKDNWSSLKKTGLKVGGKLLKCLGFVGGLAATGIVAADVAAAIEAGDHAKARQIMEDFAIETAGSEVGVKVGALLGGLIALAVGASGPVSIAIIGIGALAGGFAGGEAALTFHKWLNELSDEYKAEVVKRYSELLFGSDYSKAPITDVESLTFDSISHKVQLLSSDANEIIANAKSSEAWRYALVKLNPFVVEGADYTKHNKNGELDLYNPDTGLGNITEEWLKIRARFLAMNTLYIESGDTDGVLDFALLGGFTHVGGDWHFVDNMGKKKFELTLDGLDAGLKPTREFYFGGVDSDSFSGGEGDDYLFGISGDDTLSGGKGDDYLEGGADNDILQGEEGYDRLVGGHGDDTYIFNSGDGNDSIEDTEGLNKLIINKQLVSKVFALNEEKTLYQDNQKNIYLISGDKLHITVKGGGSISLKDFNKTDNAFGISFNDSDPTEKPQAKDNSFNVNKGDLKQLPGTQGLRIEQLPSSVAERHFSSVTSIKALNHRSLIYDASLYKGVKGKKHNIQFGTAGAAFYGSYVNDELTGDQFEDALYGLDGDDFISGQGGNDTLTGGRGSDYIEGGDGVDLIWGAADRSDTLTLDSHTTLDFRDEVGDVNTLFGNAGNDYITGGAYTDNAFGGADNDTIAGDTGDDVLAGNDGDDLVFGDSRQYVGIKATRVPNSLSSTYRFVDEIIYSDGLVDGKTYNDTLMGGKGEDTLIGEQGDDLLLGGTGNDVLYGDRPAEESHQFKQIHKAAFEGTTAELAAEYHGDDHLYGEDGNDILIGNGGDDWLYGGNDNDSLYGDDLLATSTASGNDHLYGGQGEDTLYSDLGDDYLDGGADDDTLIVREGHDTVVLGQGYGTDRVYLDESVASLSIKIKDDSPTRTLRYGSKLVVSLENSPTDVLLIEDYFDMWQGKIDIKLLKTDGQLESLPETSGTYLNAGVTDEFGDCTVIDREVGAIGNWRYGSGAMLFDTPYDDVIIGSSRDDNFSGVGGNDLINTGRGNDTLHVGIGNSLIYAGEGDDFISLSSGNKAYGEAGNDTFHMSAGDNIFIDAGEGDDEISGSFNGVVDAGAGNDLFKLQNVEGELVLIFGRGSGQDTLKFNWLISGGSKGTIQFKEGVSTEDITINREGMDVIIGIKDTDDTLTVKYYKERVADLKLTFADGQVISHDEINQRLAAQSPAIVLVDDHFDGHEDQSVTIKIDDLLANDPSQQTSVLYFEDAYASVNGTLDFPDGDTLVFKPHKDFAGQASFTYRVFDGFNTQEGKVIIDIENVNDAPKVHYQLKDVAVKANEQTTITLPRHLFKDVDSNDRLSVNVTMSDGSALPAWLSFDASSMSLKAQSPSSAQQLSLIATATDQAGAKCTQSFMFEVDASDTTSNEGGSATDNANHGNTGHATHGNNNGEVDTSQLQSIKGTDNAEQLVGTNDDDYLQGLGGNDQLFGMLGDDVVQGGEGNDFLSGGNGSNGIADGNDRLEGGAGNDRLNGGGGNDTLIGGVGDDHYYFFANSGQDVIDNTGGGNDWVFFNDVGRDRISYHRDGDDLVMLVDNDLQQKLTVTGHFTGGDLAISYIQPGDGGYAIPASRIESLLTELPAGGDTGTGDGDTSGGTDSGSGEGGDTGTDNGNGDTGTGETDNGGNDNGSDDVIDPSRYDTEVVGTAQGEQLVGRNNRNLIRGLAGDDTLFGMGGDDILLGGDGDDFIQGGNGRMNGDDGNDTLIGGAGNDVLAGFAGNDTLQGGVGDDHYYFHAQGGQDIIDNTGAVLTGCSLSILTVSESVITAMVTIW